MSRIIYKPNVARVPPLFTSAFRPNWTDFPSAEGDYVDVVTNNSGSPRTCGQLSRATWIIDKHGVLRISGTDQYKAMGGTGTSYTFKTVMTNAHSLLATANDGIFVLDQAGNLYFAGIDPYGASGGDPSTFTLEGTQRVRDLTQIASGVKYFDVTPDARRCYYITRSGKLFGSGVNNFGNLLNNPTNQYGFVELAQNADKVWAFNQNTFYRGTDNKLYTVGYMHLGTEMPQDSNLSTWTVCKRRDYGSMITAPRTVSDITGVVEMIDTGGQGIYARVMTETRHEIVACGMVGNTVGGYTRGIGVLAADRKGTYGGTIVNEPLFYDFDRVNTYREFFIGPFEFSTHGTRNLMVAGTRSAKGISTGTSGHWMQGGGGTYRGGLNVYTGGVLGGGGWTWNNTTYTASSSAEVMFNLGSKYGSYLGITSNLYGWVLTAYGANSYGQLGYGHTNTVSGTPRHSGIAFWPN